MLKHRLLTALILIPLVIGLIYFAPYPLFLSILLAIVLWAGWEWSLFCFRKKIWRLSYVIGLFLLCIGLYFYAIPSVIFYGTMLAFWLWASVAVIAYQKRGLSIGFQYRMTKILFGWDALICFGLALSELTQNPNGANYLLALLLLVWSMDTGAYFAGKFWGTRYLAQKISPKKTWEGLWGGALLTGVVYVALIVVGIIPRQNLLGQCIWIILLIYLSLMGDLFESFLKRQVGIKDSANILPGHGGLLDRIDALIAATPAFVLMLTWLQVI